MGSRAINIEPVEYLFVRGSRLDEVGLDGVEERLPPGVAESLAAEAEAEAEDAGSMRNETGLDGAGGIDLTSLFPRKGDEATICCRNLFAAKVEVFLDLRRK